jgi:AmiS/UreI family transporter.
VFPQLKPKIMASSELELRGTQDVRVQTFLPCLNGLLLIGVVEGRSAAPLNLFVGAMQVVAPTYLIFIAAGDPLQILAASGLYLFGFTYLYVGIGLLGGLDTTGQPRHQELHSGLAGLLPGARARREALRGRPAL